LLFLQKLLNELEEEVRIGKLLSEAVSAGDLDMLQGALDRSDQISLLVLFFLWDG
jgi:hypothetical protein